MEAPHDEGQANVAKLGAHLRQTDGSDVLALRVVAPVGTELTSHFAGTLFGASPFDWAARTVKSVDLKGMAVSSKEAAALPVRWHALSSLTAEFAKITYAATGTTASALIELGTPSKRGRLLCDAFEDVV